MFELVGFWLLVAGTAIVAIAQLWLVVRAFQTRWWWGLLVLVVPPAALAFIACHWQRARLPVVVLVVGLLVGAAPYGINAVLVRVDLGPRDKIVEGERHITLTGWDQNDYSVLRQRTDTVVLQMANANVTDETLLIVAELKLLKELDLNDTQVTDAGLKALAGLPRLATLRLRGTKITDEGFRQSLMPSETLMELDLRQTEVRRPTVGEWRKLKEGRRALR